MMGIFVALPIEARCFTSYRVSIGQTIAIKDNLILRVGGMGAESAKTSAHHLVSLGAQSLVSWGTAAGLAPHVKAGDLMIPDQVVDQSENTFQVDIAWRNRLKAQLPNPGAIVNGILLQADQLVTSVAAKETLFRKYQAGAVDMESAAVAAVANLFNLPFIAIRSIVDASDFAFPDWLHQSLKHTGQVKPLLLMTKLFRDPRRIPALMHLGRYFSRGKATLKSTVSQLV